MGNKVGRSLSFCVRDIVEGKVNISDVHRIQAGTKISSEEILARVIEQYKKSYWRDNPDLAEEVCRRLFREGKISQARLRKEHPEGSVEGSWWVDTDDHRFQDSLAEWRSAV